MDRMPKVNRGLRRRFSTGSSSSYTPSDLIALPSWPGRGSPLSRRANCGPAGPKRVSYGSTEEASVRGEAAPLGGSKADDPSLAGQVGMPREVLRNGSRQDEANRDEGDDRAITTTDAETRRLSRSPS
jgi:hypothetical protein